MLEQLGRIIEKRPWAVVILILLITIGFSLNLPSLKFQTNFEDFAPENAQVQANDRVLDYFGMSYQTVIVYLKKEQATSTITPQVVRDQYQLIKNFMDIPEVNASISLTTFVDIICQMEFNKTIDTCTDEQLQSAIHDLLTEQSSERVALFPTDDPNEPVDYARGLRTQSVESADLKNCYLQKDATTFHFSFEVYSLEDITTPLTPPFSRVNAMEWFLGFENILLPPEYAMKYQLAVRIQPTSPSWELGQGLLENLRHLLKERRTIRNSYAASAYLWVQPPGQDLSFPLPLTSANVTFDSSHNTITVAVSRHELATYGIAPRYGSFELPAKLNNFSAGVRYYSTPLLHRPGSRVVVNTSFLFDRLERLLSRPVLGGLAARLFERYGIAVDDLSSFSEMMHGTEMEAPTFSLTSLEPFWTLTDGVPDSGVSPTIYAVLPQLFSDLRINALSFISSDYPQTHQPQSSIIIVQLQVDTSNTELLSRVNGNIQRTIETFDTQHSSITLEATGEGIVTTQINDVTMEANTIIGPMIFILILGILFVAFRKPSYVFLPILVFAFSCIWLFGTMALLGISFSVIAVALLPLNIGLGVEYSVNILYNYRLEIRKGRTPADAIRLSIKEVGIAIFLAWFTTFVAFLSFLSATLPPVRDFGIFLALGITYTFVITMTFLVALRYIVDRRQQHLNTTQKNRSFSMAATMGRVAQVLMRHEKKVFLVTIILCLVMGTAVSQLKSGFSMTQFIPQDNPAVRLFSTIEEEFPFSSQEQEYILIEGNVATVQALQGIKQTHEQLTDDVYVARKTDQSPKAESIFTIIRQAVENNNSLVSRFQIDESTGLPATDDDVYRLYSYLYENDAYAMQVQGVLSRDGTLFTATMIRVYIDLPLGVDDVTKEFETLSAELNDDLTDYGEAEAIVTGTTLITLTILQNMTESQILSTAICFILAAIMLSLIYRNPVLGLIGMIPVSISIIWVLGSMYFIGYSLNILTITVTSITIGVGIDYSCYITSRFRLVADKTGDVKKAVTETISWTGSAISIAALASMCGFGILAFAPIPPQQQFGIITAITLIYAFISSILILPLVLARWALWRKKKRGYIISPGAPKALDGIAEDAEYFEEQ
ncbi:MAG: MMPL family transporter [Candidatus Thermoplasmatota archaeon]|nr:MMPL family transporter [Candidatus Thermoplasmatota archaeon]